MMLIIQIIEELKWLLKFWKTLKIEKELTTKTNELNKLKEEYQDDKNCDNYILLEELHEKITKLEEEVNELEEIYLSFLE